MANGSNESPVEEEHVVLTKVTGVTPVAQIHVERVIMEAGEVDQVVTGAVIA